MKFMLVTEILRTNEFSYDFKDENSPIEFYDSNQLPSNSPIEDTRSEGKCLCAKGKCGFIDLIKKYNEKYEIIPELKILYDKSFKKYAQEILLNRTENVGIQEVLESAILRLDEDISSEVLNSEESRTNLLTLNVAMSGAVACIAYIDDSHVHIANIGDCKAVLGSYGEGNNWVAKELTRDHNEKNETEINRILREHPVTEKYNLIRDGRLLGRIQPLRAFGDISYKWSVDTLMKVAVPYFGKHIIPPKYHTPPYLTAKPEITRHLLTFRDKFLIIATDGLWDKVSPRQAVHFVAEHTRGKAILNPFKLPRPNMKLKDIRSLLLRRKECFDVKPIDRNSATHLLRNALGGTDTELQYNQLCELLTLPKDIVRGFRDDITITIIYFNTEYLKSNS
ncbi:hypothetical protein PGB90_000914 [Kerria lacca]